jgi:hypothetical protein
MIHEERRSHEFGFERDQVRAAGITVPHTA